jgi:hypothetical protein
MGGRVGKRLVPLPRGGQTIRKHPGPNRIFPISQYVPQWRYDVKINVPIWLFNDRLYHQSEQNRGNAIAVLGAIFQRRVLRLQRMLDYIQTFSNLEKGENSCQYLCSYPRQFLPQAVLWQQSQRMT